MNWLVVSALAEDAAGTGEMTWLQGAVAKFTETPPEAWIVFGVILLAGILLLAGSRGGKRNARIFSKNTERADGRERQDQIFHGTLPSFEHWGHYTILTPT